MEKFQPAIARRDDGGGLLVLADGGGESLRRAAAPHGDLHLAARRGFAHQALKLRRAFHRLAVEFQHHVALLEAGLGRRTVFGQAGDFHAALFLQVESLGAFGTDVQPADAQIAAARPSPPQTTCALRPRGITTCANAEDETRLAAATNTIPRVFMAIPLTVVFV